MRNELNHIETIERYFEGSMDAAERRAFESRLQIDPGLRAEVDLQKKMVERLQLQAFKSEMMASHDELAGTGGSSLGKIFLNSLLALVGFAASAVVTALILGNAPQGEPLEIEKEIAVVLP